MIAARAQRGDRAVKSVEPEPRGAEHESVARAMSAVMRQAVERCGRAMMAANAPSRRPARLVEDTLSPQELHRHALARVFRQVFRMTCRTANNAAIVEPLFVMHGVGDPGTMTFDLHGAWVELSMSDGLAGDDPVAHFRACVDAYESLLDLRPVIDTKAETFELVSGPRTQRKSTGSFYTPAPLIGVLLDSALEPSLAAAARSDDAERAILNLCVCDPACGTGRFLLAAGERMAVRLAQVRCAQPQPSAGALTAARRDVARRCLHGIDLDPLAVELCRMSLWLWAEASQGTTAGLAANIRYGDALLEAAGDDGDTVHRPGRSPASTAAPARRPCHLAYDVIIGNPPYGAAEVHAHRDRLNRLYPSARTAGNSAGYFLVRCAQLAKPDGRIGLVMPKSLTYSHAWAGLRAWLRPGLTHVVDVSRAWPEVLLEQVLVTYRPPDGLKSIGRPRLGQLRALDADTQLTVLGARLTGQANACSRADGRHRSGGATAATPSGSAPHSRFSLRLLHRSRNRVLWHRASPGRLIDCLGVLPTGVSEQDRVIAEGMLDRADATLGELCTTQRGTGLQRHKSPTGDIPVIGGKDLTSFGEVRASRYLDAGPLDSADLRWTRPPQAVFQNIIAHLTKPADHIHLIGTVATRRVVCLDTVNLLSPVAAGLSPFALAGLLMSDLINWFVHTCIYNRAVRTMHLDGYFLRKIPAPAARRLARLEAPARRLLDHPRAESAWTALNREVYRLYGVDRATAGALSASRLGRWQLRSASRG